MGADGPAYVLYRLRSAEFAVALSAKPSVDGEAMEYRGTILGFEDAFEQPSYVARVPMSMLDRVADLVVDTDTHVLSIDDGAVVDEVVLHDLPMRSADGLMAMIGSVTDEGDVVDVAVLDDPTTVVIVVIGAATLVCLARLGLTAWLTDRADKRRSDAGQKFRVVIDGSTDGEISFSKLHKLKAKLRCHLRVELVNSEGKVVETYTKSERKAKKD
jgi:hypothetical protein